MRLARALCAAFLPLVVAGCLSDRESIAARWRDRLPLFRSAPDADTAFVEYVVAERAAGGDDVNRRVWDRIDEQGVPYETRAILEENGLRAGTIGGSTPGPLRGMIDDPRTSRGHRFRSFPLDKPAPLMVAGPLSRAEFALAGSQGPMAFAHDQINLGFELIVREAPDGKVIVKFVPQARFREPMQLLPSVTGERDQGSESFPAAGFEIALSPNEYLVVGTDVFRPDTFGYAAFTDVKDGRPVQRLLVLRAGLTKADRGSPGFLGSDDRAGAAPLATQAGIARASRP